MFRKGLHPKLGNSVLSFLVVFLTLPSFTFAHTRLSTYIGFQQDSRIATAAERDFAEGQQLLAEGSAVSKQKAIERFDEAARQWHDTGDKRRQAIALSFIGKTYDLLGEKEKALDFYSQTLVLVRAVSDRSSEAATLNNIGLIYDSLGEKQKALNYYESALPILQSVGNTHVQGITLVNIGLAYDSIGEKQQALRFYQQALTLLRSTHDRGSEAVTLNNIGYLYDSIGEQQKALVYFGQALPILQEIGDRRLEAITLNNVGYVYDAMGDKEKALDYYDRALPVLRAVGDRRMEAITLNNIGLVQKAVGDNQKALDFLNQALALRRAVNDRSGEGITLSDLGSVYTNLGEDEKAFDLYEESLKLSRAAEDKSTESSTLRRLALIEINHGRLEEALKQLEEALKIVEHLRTRIPGQELRASYFASVQQFFETYIGVLLRLHREHPAGGYDALALEAAERARARSLLDSLIEARANIREGVAPALLDRERELQQKLDATAERQARLLSIEHSEQQLTALKQQTETLLTQYQEVETEIRISSPRYAALTQPQTLSASEIQEGLDSNTMLVEYFLGDEKSFLWAVSNSSIQSFELPPRKTIEMATRRVYELLTERNKTIAFEKPAQQNARITQGDADYVSEATNLSQSLLGPLATQWGQKRLLIVADGALHYLPFTALPDPINKSPLVTEHEIVNLPSASTLAVLRRQLRGRTAAPRTLAVIADPVFEKNDERLAEIKRSGSKKPTNRSALESRTRVLGHGAMASDGPQQSDSDEVIEIHRLRFTRREAEQILALVPEKDRLRALDFDANKAIATSPRLGHFRYVHFATHGFLNTTHPELSGIVLSLVNQQGAEQDGFLWTNDVYNLRLSAEMVVLSGCRTGLGKQIRGEGLVGLTRGFMYAGSKRVLVSLWDISDEASAALMTQLYKKMLKDHLSPAAALRAAQIEIMKDKRWEAPYYWAAFVLQGEPQ